MPFGQGSSQQFKGDYSITREYNKCWPVSNKGRYVFNWTGWAGALEGRVICKYFTNLGGSNLFYMQPGEGHSFLARKKITPCQLVYSYSLANAQSVQKPKACLMFQTPC